MQVMGARLATTVALLGTVPSPGLRAKGKLQPGAVSPGLSIAGLVFHFKWQSTLAQ